LKTKAALLLLLCSLVFAGGVAHLREAEAARDFDLIVGEVLSTDSDLVGSPPFTVSVWFYSTDDTINTVLFYAGDKDDNDDSAFWLRPLSTNVVWWSAIESGAANAATTTTFTVNTWNHACAVEASATDRRVYLNGAGKGTNTTSKVPAGIDRTTLTADNDTAQGFPFAGSVAHVAIWNVALSDAEVNALAKGAHPYTIKRGALTHYWPIRGDSPEIDLVGGANLTVSGTPVQIGSPPVRQP